MFQIFRRFEYPAEISRINYFNTTLLSKRENFIQQIVNNSDIRNLDFFISSELENYEKILQDAFTAGIPLFPREQLVKWTTLKAVFFSSTVLTTIGKYTAIINYPLELESFCSILMNCFVIGAKLNLV